jgi:hypothetical protein
MCSMQDPAQPAAVAREWQGVAWPQQLLGWCRLAVTVMYCI